ncbi:MAG: dihydrolipoamide acetyltransferase family protein [Bacteroidales bacterium]|jgi:2-oxoglutarate dehydrogenase E2 component (dihydrolipoamide succinyltransferase)|nr:dihydrolipoamide acetyltransferase family protein [Bacteroidales bacterium]
MAKIEILLPAMGEGIIEATITKWLVSVGDVIEEDQSLVEVATDKVDSEIPAPEAGVIEKLLFNEDDIPKVGDTIAILSTSSKDTDQAEEIIKENKPKIESNIDDKSTPYSIASIPSDNKPSELIISKTPEGKFLSPLVKSIAEKEHVSVDELDNINGSGNTGRITKKDIINYLNTRTNSGIDPNLNLQLQKETTVTKTPKPQISNDQIYSGGDYEIIEMDRMRKLIAEHMVHSKQTSPHVTSFIETDVTNIVNWRNKNKDKVLEQENIKLTFTHIFVEATVKALKDFPMINVSVDKDKIIRKKNINIGIAAALPSGNLIVPVIKNADRLNLLGIASSVNDLASRARNNKLKPDEIQGGTFTITNFGSFGNTTGTPIINQPQVAILGVGAIVKKPAVIETPSGDAIAIRHMMILSLAYDHRVVDGALGGMFLKRISDYLQNFDFNRNV